jgi:hypothetical protein
MCSVARSSSDCLHPSLSILPNIITHLVHRLTCSLHEMGAANAKPKAQPAPPSVSDVKVPPSYSSAAPPASASQSKSWIIKGQDEILLIEGLSGFPHLLPLNPKHIWPITADRRRFIEKEAKQYNPSALCVLGTLTPSRLQSVQTVRSLSFLPQVPCSTQVWVHRATQRVPHRTCFAPLSWETKLPA